MGEPMSTRFYFDDVAQLFDFESFEVKAAENNQGGASSWTVIGTAQGQQSPMADLPSERYASLFVELCEQITTMGTDSEDKKDG